MRGVIAVPRSATELLVPAETTTSSLLELKGVNAFYGAAQALVNLSLRVNEGEIVCLLGGDASGKSTILKVILGLLRPRTGEVLLNGNAITLLSTAEISRRGVVAVPDAKQIFPNLTIEENLGLGVDVHRRRSVVREDLQRMYRLFPRLGDRRHQRAGTLNPGELEMLAFGRALMSRPRLICIDEPTMGLAAGCMQRILDKIMQMNRMGVTILLMEQNAEFALGVASRIYVLQDGALVLQSAVNESLDHRSARGCYAGQRSA